MICKILAVVLAAVSLAGCWNGENVHVSLGDVSLGQQLLDLQTAVESEAMTREEYEATKKTLLSLNGPCEESEPETSWF